MSAEIKPLPCPFCGGPSEACFNKQACLACGADGPTVYDDANGDPPSESELIAAWNLRYKTQG